MWKLKFENEISIVISGAAGQGLQTLEQLLLRIMKSVGYNVFAYSEFMSRIRGGNNSTEIRVSSVRVASFVDRADIFIPVDAGAMKRFEKRISADTLIIGREKHIEDGYKQGNNHLAYLASEDADKEAGEKIIINIVILGLLCGLMAVDMETVKNFIKEYFHNLTSEKIQDNFRSLEKGYDFFREKLRPEIEYPLFSPSVRKNEEPLLYGSEAIAIGALAGGCNFIASYPMSPGTNVLVFMAENAGDLGIVVEQSEDEISAMNMALGSWYAGGRAMVTTAGGGFALMIEGLSLAGAIESPMVIHIGQRPAPATGLPTRTEQADLLMVLYAGHGEFPRAILAPGTKKDGIILAARAFEIADKYQVPVFILTDQYFLDSAYNAGEVDISNIQEKKYITETGPDYKRHLFTKDGISPRGIPGWGSGIVCVDSDEHCESGYITEDFEMRTGMVDKRLKKLKAMKDDIIPPELLGNDNYKYLLVAWGSTFEAIKEAMKIIQNNELSFLHFSQVYPLHEITGSFLKKAEKTIIIENNATSQFGRIIKSETGFQIDNAILKYNGMPFSVEELVQRIKGFL